MNNPRETINYRPDTPQDYNTTENISIDKQSSSIDRLISSIDLLLERVNQKYE